MNRYTQTSLITVARKLKFFAIFLVAIMTVLPAHPAFAASRQVTLAVSNNMTCSTCPLTVRKALFAVHGVEKVAINLDRKETAVTFAVTFDDAQTTVNALTKATEDVGYPTKVVEVRQ